jgi:hypothetical protein
LNNKGLQKCINISYINPVLENTNNASRLYLKFTDGYGKIYNSYKKASVITISGYNSSDFSYSIQQSEDDFDEFDIYLNANRSITGGPSLTLQLNPPPENNLLVYQIEEDTLTVKLNDIYVLNEKTKQLIEKSKEATKTVDSITSSAFSANNFLTIGATFAFKCISSVDIIRLDL